MIIPLKGTFLKNKDAIQKLNWDDKTYEYLQSTKDIYFLVISTKIDNFDPMNDKYILIKFPEALTQPTKYVDVLNEIAQEIKSGSDIFEWCNNKNKTSSKLLSKLFNSIEMKPGMFGFTIDLKTIFS